MMSQATFPHTPQQTDAFLALYDAQWASLVRRCERIVVNRHEAEDVAQEALLILARRLEHLPADANLEAYLWVVAKRLAVRRRQAMRPTDALHEVDLDRLAGSELDPADAVLRDELAREVHRAVDTISPRQRRALVAYELEDRTYAEIGEELGLNANAVAQLLHRARASTRGALQAA